MIVLDILVRLLAFSGVIYALHIVLEDIRKIGKDEK